MSPTQESNLFSIPLTVQVDESSTDFTQWTVSNFVYCNQARTSHMAVEHVGSHSQLCNILLSSCNRRLSLGQDIRYAAGLLCYRVPSTRPLHS